MGSDARDARCHALRLTKARVLAPLDESRAAVCTAVAAGSRASSGRCAGHDGLWEAYALHMLATEGAGALYCVLERSPCPPMIANGGRGARVGLGSAPVGLGWVAGVTVCTSLVTVCLAVCNGLITVCNGLITDGCSLMADGCSLMADGCSLMKLGFVIAIRVTK